MSLAFPASLQDAKVILGRLPPGCPFAVLRVHPGLTSCRPYGTPLGTPAVRRAVLEDQMGFVDPRSENPDLGVRTSDTRCQLVDSPV